MTRLPVVLLVLALVAAGCSGGRDDEVSAAAPATSTPTAVGDRSRVEVLDDGAEPRQVLGLGTGATEGATLTIDQEIVADRRVTDPPPVSIALDSTTTADGARLDVATTYTGVDADDDAVRQGLQPLVGTTDEVSLLRDGTTESPTAAATPQLAQVRAQLLTLTPVVPTDEVGVGASWQVASVVEVDGATVDQLATYTLESLDGDAYVIGVEVAQQYRTGVVEQVTVKGGKGTVSGRIEGDLGTLLPTSASATVSTSVTYDLGADLTIVRTNVALGLSAGG